MDGVCDIEVTSEISIEPELSEFDEDIEESDPVENVTNEFYQKMIPIIIYQLNNLGENRAEIYFKNGNKYVGEIEDMKLQGDGVFFWANGNVYDGMFYRNFPEGYGKFTNGYNESYEGNFKRGIKHGEGELHGENFVYVGSFKFGKFHGRGRYMSPGFCFEGIFANNKIIEGIGKYPHGVFIGEYDEFEQRKSGKFFFSKTNDIYCGPWQNNNYHGFGKYQWYTPVSPNPLINFRKEYYIGYWNSGLQDGIGLITFQNIIVMCNWKMGVKHGPGFIIAKNGDLFIHNELFLNNQYNKSCQLLPNPYFKQQIEDLLRINDNDTCFKFEIPNHSFEEMPPCVEIFNSIINNMMGAIERNIEIDIYPIFIFDFNLGASFPYIQAIQQKYYTTAMMTLENISSTDFYYFELKTLNQVVRDNLKRLYEIYYEYTTVCGPITEKEYCYMPRLGLWLFYFDTLKYFPNITASKVISTVESCNQIFVNNYRCATESVYFWQFLRHLFHIITILSCSNNFMAGLMLADKSENFGYLATMLLVFMRELRVINRFSNSSVVKILQKNQIQLVLSIFKAVENYTDEFLTFSSIYRFIDEYRKSINFLILVTDDDLFTLGKKLFPNLIVDGCLQDTTFHITPLEFWEVILLCVENNVHKEKVSEIRQQMLIQLEAKMRNQSKAVKGRKK